MNRLRSIEAIIFIPVVSLFLFFTFIPPASSTVATSNPPRGNYVPVDLRTKIHPFVQSLRSPTNQYLRGTLRRTSGDKWRINYEDSGKSVSKPIQPASINIEPLPEAKEVPVVIKKSEASSPIVTGYDRTMRYLWLGLISIGICILVGGIITARALLGIVVGLTYLYLLGLPDIISGGSILLHVCIFYGLSVIIILPSSLGIRRATLSAMFTATITGLISLLFLLLLTNWIETVGLRNESLQLLEFGGRYFPGKIAHINLSNLIVGSSLIGSLGVILDVSVDVTSSAAEISRKRPDLGINQLLKRSLTVSKRLIGTMTNTLLMAYIGSNLFLLLTIYLLPTSGRILLNKDLVATESIRAFGGALGFLIAVPLAVLCYWMTVLLSRSEPPPPPK